MFGFSAVWIKQDSIETPTAIPQDQDFPIVIHCPKVIKFVDHADYGGSSVFRVLNNLTLPKNDDQSVLKINRSSHASRTALWEVPQHALGFIGDVEELDYRGRVSVSQLASKRYDFGPKDCGSHGGDGFF